MTIELLLPPNNSIRIDPKSVFKLYLQLKNHFNGRGDVIKTNWRMNLSDAAYAKRKDKFFFVKLSEKFTLKELALIFIGNLVSNQDAWIGEISDSDAVTFYHTYLARLKQLRFRYEEDVKNIYHFARKVNLNALGDVFKYNEDHNSSYIFKMLQGGIISFETFIMLDSFLNIIEEHDKYDNIVWSSYSVRLHAYRKLFKVDKDECVRMFRASITAAKY